MILDRKHPNEMLVGLNLRDRRVFDIYRVDLTTGAVVPDTVNPGDVVAWQTDPDFVIRGAMARNPKDGSTILRVRERRDAPWRDLVVWPFGENGGVEDFTADGKALFVETSIGSDTTRLVKVDAATGKELETIASNPKCDISGVLVQPDTHEVQAVTFNYLTTEWRAIDPNLRDDLAAIGGIHHGVFAIQSRDAADRNWVVAFSSDSGPAAWYAYHRDTRKADFLFVSQPELEKAGLAAMEPVVIKSRDGYELVAYLTLPAGIEAHNLPLVLNVHGGPWGRDNWGFRPDVQWLANRGYACLQVNFRGSTGFGKKLLNAGNGQWGVGSMQHDLTDAVRWAIGKGIATRSGCASTAAPTAGTRRWPAWRSRPSCTPAAWTSWGRRTSRPCSPPSRRTGPRSRASSCCASATPRRTMRSTARSRPCSTWTPSAPRC